MSVTDGSIVQTGTVELVITDVLLGIAVYTALSQCLW